MDVTPGEILCSCLLSKTSHSFKVFGMTEFSLYFVTYTEHTGSDSD